MGPWSLVAVMASAAGSPLPHGFARSLKIFSVLTTTRIGTVTCLNDGERVFDARIGHRSHRVGKEWMPVPIPPVDGKPNASTIQLRTESVDDRPNLPVDRTDPTEMMVMLGDFEQTLSRDVPSPSHVLKKWHHIFRILGTAKADDQNRAGHC